MFFCTAQFLIVMWVNITLNGLRLAFVLICFILGLIML